MANTKTHAQAYCLEMNKQCPLIAKYSRNLNLMHTTGKLDPCYHRESVIEQIQKTLLRKNKANILLTGPAGCGKTAIVEGLAAILAERKEAYEAENGKRRKAYMKAQREEEIKREKGLPAEKCPPWEPLPKPPLCDCVVYDLSLTALVGGTKYRGEFEERLQDLICECKKQPNVILFIDEFHTVMKAGATEGSPAAAQMLKPAIARKDVRLIGATTTQEASDIMADSAFARRLLRMEIQPLMADAAVQTAERILKNYSNYHKITVKEKAENLLSMANSFIPNGVFPDHFIDLVDETLSGAAFDGQKTVSMQDFSATLSRMTGSVIMTLNDFCA